MPVPGRSEVAVLLTDAEVKIAWRPRLPFEQMPVMESTAPMLQTPFPLDLIGMYDFHGFTASAEPDTAIDQVAAEDDIEQSGAARK